MYEVLIGQDREESSLTTGRVYVLGRILQQQQGRRAVHYGRLSWHRLYGGACSRRTTTTLPNMCLLRDQMMSPRKRRQPKLSLVHYKACSMVLLTERIDYYYRKGEV